MHLTPVLGALTLLIASTWADTLPSSTNIFYWPVGAAQPSVLAHIAYDPTSLKSTVLSYHPPRPGQADTTGGADSADNLVRLGLYTSTPSNPKQWTGSLVALSSLTGVQHPPTLRLHLGPANEVYHVSLAAFEPASAKTKTSEPHVELVASEPGVQPRLNRPVVVGPDGQNAEEVPEKTLLQK